MGGEKILLVEDDELLRESLVVILKSLGYDVEPCACDEEADQSTIQNIHRITPS